MREWVGMTENIFLSNKISDPKVLALSFVTFNSYMTSGTLIPDKVSMNHRIIE